MAPTWTKRRFAKMWDFLSNLGPSPEEPSSDPMDIDDLEKLPDRDLDEVFHFKQESDKVDESYKVNPLTAMNKAMVLWSWRRVSNVQTLIKCIDADEHTSEFLTTSFSSSGFRFRPWLVEVAQNYYARVQGLIQTSNKPPLNWVYCCSNNENDIDKIVMAYLHFVPISRRFDPDYADIYFEICQAVLSSGVEQDAFKPDKDLLAAEIAFQQEAHGDRHAAGPVLDQVRSYYDAYNSADHIAPYTAIIGPSGIGKSFARQELARKGLYVVYTSLANKASGAYPRRSKIADFIEKFQDTEREQVTIFFECYIAANLVNIELYIQYEISPVGFSKVKLGPNSSAFSMQSRDMSRTCTGKPIPQSAIPENVQTTPNSLITKAICQSHSIGIEQTPINSFRLSQSMRTHAQMAAYLQPKKSEQPIIICMDEAWALFKEPRQEGTECEYQFLAFRRALRHQSNISENEDQKRFFALLLYTSSKISDFTAPRVRDVSLKKENAEGEDLLPPIYQVNSMDILAKNMTHGWKELKEAIRTNKPGLPYLYTLGRPLWAARLRAVRKQDRDTSAESSTRAFATSKVMVASEGNRRELIETQHIALFSYRINFQVVPVYDIAEELTSSYMRYIYGVDETRVFIQTYQPSEPILALTSQRRMNQLSSIRADVVKAFYTNIIKGTIHLGDLGEVAAALILFFAFDKAQQSTSAKPIKLSQFLFTPFSDDVANAIRERAMGLDGLRTIWEEGTLFFQPFHTPGHRS